MNTDNTSNKIQYIAHKTEDGRIQTIKQHLNNTADLSEKFAVKNCKSIAREIAKGHDIGKYSEAFQLHINGRYNRVEHAICGAKEFRKIMSEDCFLPMIEYCIAGHHTGLPDGGASSDMEDKPTLAGRMKRETEDYQNYCNEITLEKPDTTELLKCFIPFMKNKNTIEMVELYAFITKYVFSCLTDADFLDTERFCNPDYQRGLTGDFEAAYELVNNKLSSFSKDTAVREARAKLLDQAVENSKSSKQINILNMPTGSGKTLCSLKIALNSILRDASATKKRIIYVIPYTSIIEQTADTFTSIFGDKLEVLQHHSNYFFDNENNTNYEENEAEDMAKKLKRTCENWDAPLIITTSVQFFQSLYHYRGSGLRKLHNLADSIIIFDEIHLIPLEYIQPCLRAIGYITKYLNSQAIFLSATMPDYSPMFRRFLPDNTICELITEKSNFQYFKNCHYTNLGKKSFEEVIDKASGYQSCLIIVNKKASAQYIYEHLEGKKFHLSAFMTPDHRSIVIGDIRRSLKNNEKITVVSTSLVEAGVDFDFHAVFRQLAGLDSILQSGGRCNREGKREEGWVFIFETDEMPKSDMGIRSNITAAILREYEDITSVECIEDYYNRLFQYYDKNITQNSIASFGGNRFLTSIPFRSYAESFEYIKADTIGIVVDRTEDSHRLIGQLEVGNMGVRRKLQKYTVALSKYQFDELYKLGIVQDYSGVFVLGNNDYYDKSMGLVLNIDKDKNYIA